MGWNLWVLTAYYALMAAVVLVSIWWLLGRTGQRSGWRRGGADAGYFGGRPQFDPNLTAVLLGFPFAPPSSGCCGGRLEMAPSGVLFLCPDWLFRDQLDHGVCACDAVRHPAGAATRSVASLDHLLGLTPPWQDWSCWPVSPVKCPMLRCFGGLGKNIHGLWLVIPLWPGSDHQTALMRLLAANLRACCRCCFIGWLGWRRRARADVRRKGCFWLRCSWCWWSAGDAELFWASPLDVRRFFLMGISCPQSSGKTGNASSMAGNPACGFSIPPFGRRVPYSFMVLAGGCGHGWKRCRGLSRRLRTDDAHQKKADGHPGVMPNNNSASPDLHQHHEQRQQKQPSA